MAWKFIKPKKKDIGEDVIIVSGLPRSGTSMMMKMLEAGGLEILTDDIRTADENNPKGYYEFERVKKLADGNDGWVSDSQGKVVKVISYLLDKLPGDYHYKIIFIQRDIDEILASQRRMLERDGKPDDGISDEEMKALYGKHLESVKAWLERQANIDVQYSSYNEIMSDPEPHAAEINSFLGGNLDKGAMAAVVDKSLYRERRK